MLHAVLRPSDARRWFHCPGSVVLQGTFPETGRSESAVEGDAVHWMSAEVLQGRSRATFLGVKAPNGVVINEDMVFAAMLYVEHIASVVDGPGTVGVVAERKVEIRRIHTSLCWGTPDAWYYDQIRQLLHVFDLKYGYGLVEAKENKQALCYTAGILQEIADIRGTAVGAIDTKIDVHIHIIQPRAPHRFGPVRTWQAGKAVNLRGVFNQLEGAASAAMGTDPECISGGHCKNCDALHVCEAAKRASYNAIDVTEALEPHILTGQDAVSEYLALKRAEAAIKNRLSAREGNLIAKIQAGEFVPGLVLDRGQGRRAWTKSVSEVLALGDALKKDLRAEQKVLTPAKAKQKGIPEEVLAAYSATGGSSLKLLPAEASFAAQAFGSSHEG